MKRLEAKPVVEKINARLRTHASEFEKKYGRKPKLCVVLVGKDPASVIYTRKKGEAAAAVGFLHETIELPQSATETEVKKCVEKLNHDQTVDGILIQRPLSFEEERVVYWIDPAKDVDCFHPELVGRLVLGMPGLRSCTPSGVMALLGHYGIQISGMNACVVGRSAIVGKPMAALLLAANATVTHCHSKTTHLTELTRQADLLVVAAGKPEMIRGDDIKKGAVVIDVGMHRKGDGKLCGDVHAESAAKVASALTPVPGGVGPMTIALLLENTLQAALTRQISGR